ncbi:MAG: Rne/Rng family ribonuclease [Bdellovibrio sp.]|nr:Rne/Rng family ribonuclease [Bdellovibrio sp.]
MSTELIVNSSLPEIRISLLENGEIQELLVERPSEKGIVGNIYKGRVTRVLPGMQAAFVDIGLEKAAFLYVDDVYVHSQIWDDEEEEGGDSLIETELEAPIVREQGENELLQVESENAPPSDDEPSPANESPSEEESAQSELPKTQTANIETSTDNSPVSPQRMRRGGKVGRQGRGGGHYRGRQGRVYSNSRDRRIAPQVSRFHKSEVNIQDLLHEGQEVIVQVAKAPIATKGARLTCHISLPGRYLVCMPTIDHVGISRKIDREDERRRLREQVENNRPSGIGFIVRTATGRGQSEKRIKQDIDYLTKLWGEIKESTSSSTAPSLVYEDLNAVLRSIRDWVSEDIDKIIVDSRYYYNEILQFVSYFMPVLKQKVELYHGDIPVFDAYNISPELSRALERKVWLKSGGYIVIDQTEALVSIDVNTGRFVGKKNLEDTILRTNLEAIEEIAYQLRLRNCGGIIILDLIDMEHDENRYRVYRALEEALEKDKARPTILKISELGLIEMTRKRTRDTMVRTLSETCAHCEGKGFIKTKQTVAYEVLREIERIGIDRQATKFLVQAHPDVIDILAFDNKDTLDQLERRYRKQIYLQAVYDFHPEQFEVSTDKTIKKVRFGEKSSKESPVRTPNRKEAVEKVTENVMPTADVSIQTESTNSSDTVTVSEIKPQGKSLGKHPGKPEEEFNEEDRLAFVRAQAAQDAALAQGTLSKTHKRIAPGAQRPQRTMGSRWRGQSNNPRIRNHQNNDGGRQHRRFGRLDRDRNYHYNKNRHSEPKPAETSQSTKPNIQPNIQNDTVGPTEVTVTTTTENK